jgi:hypothetical protein
MSDENDPIFIGFPLPSGGSLASIGDCKHKVSTPESHSMSPRYFEAEDSENFESCALEATESRWLTTFGEVFARQTIACG